MAARVLERSLDDITLPQYRVLTLIASSPERAGRVAERAAMSRPSLTGILDGLVARGWVQRSEVAGDRRGVHLEVTPAGRQRLAAADEELAAGLEHVLAGLDGAERAAVLDGLAVLQTALAAHFQQKPDHQPDQKPEHKPDQQPDQKPEQQSQHKAGRAVEHKVLHAR